MLSNNMSSEWQPDRQVKHPTERFFKQRVLAPSSVGVQLTANIRLKDLNIVKNLTDGYRRWYRHLIDIER